MKQGLQLRFSQQLAMTPQLQQAIRLLQLSTLELQQEIQLALESNPLLEQTDLHDEIDAVETPDSEGLDTREALEQNLEKAVGAEREKMAADLKVILATFQEQGYRDVVLNDWFAFFVSAKTPPAHVQRLNAAIKSALATPAVMKALEDRGLEPRWSTSADMAALLKSNMAQWAPIVKSFNFSADS